MMSWIEKLEHINQKNSQICKSWPIGAKLKVVSLTSGTPTLHLKPIPAKQNTKATKTRFNTNKSEHAQGKHIPEAGQRRDWGVAGPAQNITELY